MDFLSAAVVKPRLDAASFAPTVAFPVTERSSADAWARLPAAHLSRKQLKHNHVVSLDESHVSRVAFDVMRTKALKACRSNNWTVVGITAPTVECGTTSVTLNLAFSLARQVDCRIVVLDLNLRKPAMARILGLTPTSSMDDFLSGRASVDMSFVRQGDNLAIGTSSRPAPRPSEILQAPAAIAALESLKRSLSPDIILVDLPPMRASDDTMGFLPRLDCALLVVQAGNTSVADIDTCERDLARETTVLGVVLNRCELLTEGHAY